MPEYIGKFDINIGEEFNNQISTHLDVMRAGLDSLKMSRSAQEHNRPSFNAPMLIINKSEAADKEWLTQQIINSAFLSIVRSAVDLMDLILGVKELFSGDIVLKRDIAGSEDLLIYLRDEMSQRAVATGRQRGLSSPGKVERIGGLTPFLEKSLLSMIEARRILEHHKGFVERDFDFATYSIRLLIDGVSQSGSLPIDFQAGQMIGVTVVERVQTFLASEALCLNEVDINEVSTTLTQWIVPAQIQTLGPPSHDQTLATPTSPDT